MTPKKPKISFYFSINLNFEEIHTYACHFFAEMSITCTMVSLRNYEKLIFNADTLKKFALKF